MPLIKMSFNKCHFAECHCYECHFSKFHLTKCHICRMSPIVIFESIILINVIFVECHSAECHFSKFHLTKCHFCIMSLRRASFYKMSWRQTIHSSPTFSSHDNSWVLEGRTHFILSFLPTVRQFSISNGHRRHQLKTFTPVLKVVFHPSLMFVCLAREMVGNGVV